jgi:hypothetical protein
MRSLIILIAVFFYSSSFSQNFRIGTVVLDFNTGLEGYSSTSTYTQTGSDTVVEWFTTNANLSLGLEVGLSKRFGIGLRGKLNSFSRELDQVTDSRADIDTKDFTMVVNFHPVNRKNVDLIIGSEFGLSKLFIDVNDLSNSQIIGKGGYYAFYLNPRVYFGRLGINLKTYLPFLNYKNLLSDDGDPGKYMLSRWKGSGFGVSLGVQLRLF